MSYDMHLQVARFEQLIIRLDDGTMTMLRKPKLTLTCLFKVNWTLLWASPSVFLRPQLSEVYNEEQGVIYNNFWSWKGKSLSVSWFVLL